MAGRTRNLGFARFFDSDSLFFCDWVFFAVAFRGVVVAQGDGRLEEVGWVWWRPVVGSIPGWGARTDRSRGGNAFESIFGLGWVRWAWVFYVVNRKNWAGPV